MATKVKDYKYYQHIAAGADLGKSSWVGPEANFHYNYLFIIQLFIINVHVVDNNKVTWVG